MLEELICLATILTFSAQIISEDVHWQS